MRLLIGLVALAGCSLGPRSVGPFVRAATVEGADLVLELCTIHLDDDRLQVGECRIERRPMVVTVLGPPGASQSPRALDVERPPDPDVGPAAADVSRACFQAVRLDGQATKPFCYPSLKVCRQQLATVRAQSDVYAAAGDCEELEP